MSELGVDLNRGFVYSKTLDGVQVGYYPDDPCTFYAMNGREVPADFARQAFDGGTLEKLRKRCAYNTRIKQAADAIQAELDEDVGAEERPVIEERGGLKVIDIGLGRGRVVDEDNQPMHTAELTKEQAINLLHRLVPDAPTVDKKA